jgi:hypothetical protein
MAVLRNGNNMKHGATKLVLALALFAVGIGGMSSIASAKEEGSGLSARIEGTWILTINRLNEGISFSALQSFTAGGVTLATGTIDRTPPPPISPLYGSWRRLGHNTHAVAICFFVFDAAGNAVAMIKTLETLQVVDNNNLTGSGGALLCDIHGDNCVDVNSPITITGKRLIAQSASD